MIRKFKFPRYLAVTPVKVSKTELSEDAGPVPTTLYDGLCIYYEKMKQVLDKERKLVTLSGKIIIEGDISPGILIQGYVDVNGAKRDIFTSERKRNPDGSIFSTVLELI